MTLGMGLVVLGLANVWQLVMVQTGSGVPSELRWLGSATFAGLIPASLLVFVPLAAFVLLLLRRTGYGRLLYAVGDNPIAARLAGARELAGADRAVRALGADRGDRRVPLLGPQQHGAA